MNKKTLKERLTVEWLQENLPTGAGIGDGYQAWEVTDKGRYIKCEQNYHLMNDTGYYIGYIDFSIIVFKKPESLGMAYVGIHGQQSELFAAKFNLHFHTNGRGYYWINKKDLRNYLEDMFAEMINVESEKERAERYRMEQPGPGFEALS